MIDPNQASLAQSILNTIATSYLTLVALVSGFYVIFLQRQEVTVPQHVHHRVQLMLISCGALSVAEVIVMGNLFLGTLTPDVLAWEIAIAIAGFLFVVFLCINVIQEMIRIARNPPPVNTQKKQT